MKKRTKIGIGVLLLVVIVVAAMALSGPAASSFNREGKFVDAPAKDLLPDVENFPGNGWDVEASDDIIFIPEDAVSKTDAVYMAPGAISYKIVYVTIIVYESSESAELAYDEHKSNSTGTEDYDKFEQSFKWSTIGSHTGYVFQDMNVYGSVETTEIITKSQWNKIFSDIQDKIIDNASDIDGI